MWRAHRSTAKPAVSRVRPSIRKTLFAKVEQSKPLVDQSKDRRLIGLSQLQCAQQSLVGFELGLPLKLEGREDARTEPGAFEPRAVDRQDDRADPRCNAHDLMNIGAGIKWPAEAGRRNAPFHHFVDRNEQDPA